MKNRMLVSNFSKDSPENILVSETATIRKTPLNAEHRRLGAKMVDFGGWDMPVEYSGILAEHHAVRTAAGLFDVSHMGEIEIRGPRALDLVQWVTSNDAGKLAVGQIQYSGLMTDQGTFVDDILVHKISDTHYFLCVNAGNQDKDFAHIVSHNRFGSDAQVENSGPKYTQLAIQGPKAISILHRFVDINLMEFKYYRFAFGRVDGVDSLIARTGYTGEDGFEVYFPPQHSERIWNALLEGGKQDGLIPCGLGARNTLRLEAAMCLYGHEIDDTTTVLDAGLGWICKLEKGDFLGRAPLLAQKQAGLKRVLVGFAMEGKLIARDGYPVLASGKEVGKVTSGSPSPTLKKNIGMAYVPAEFSAVGTKLEIAIRNQTAPAQVVKLPFYKRAQE